MKANSDRLAASSKKAGEKLNARRIVVCLPLTLFLLTVAHAQQSMKLPRIGFVATVSPSTIWAG